MLKELMKSRNVTQKNIALVMKVNQSLVSQWCSGKCEPHIYQLKILCELLKVDIETLIDCIPKPN